MKGKPKNNIENIILSFVQNIENIILSFVQKTDHHGIDDIERNKQSRDGEKIGETKQFNFFHLTLWPLYAYIYAYFIFAFTP